MPRIVLNAGELVTMDDQRRVLAPGHLVVDGNRIVEVGPGRRPPEPMEQHVDAADALVLPGFVNSHDHLAATLIRGVGEPQAGTTARSGARRDLHAAMDESATYAGTALAAVELIRSGVTTTVDSQLQWRSLRKADGSLRALSEAGLRTLFCAAFIDRTELSPPTEQLGPAEATATFDRIRDRWSSDLLHVIPEALFAPRASDELIRRLVVAGDGRLATHLAYSPAVDEWARSTYGRPLVEHLDTLAALAPGFLGAHPVRLSQREVDLLADRGGAVAYCAISNMYIGSPHAALHPLRDAGVPIGLGLDTPNDGRNFFETMKLSLLAQTQAEGEPEFHAGHALEWATVGGAAAVGLGDEVGSLQVGRRADLVVLRARQAELWPPAARLSLVVTSAGPATVRDVMVDGRWLLRDGRCITLDEPAVLQQAAVAQARALESVGLPPRAWPERWSVPG